MNLELQFKAHHERHMQFPLYRWLRIYMQQVETLLQFHRSVREPNFLLYLASLEDMSTYFFAYNRLDYAQNIMEFLARAYESKETHRNIWYRLVSGEFAVTKSKIPFTTIGGDHAQEQMNKDLKGEGGLQGITNKPATLLRYCLAAPVLSRISKETEDMLGFETSKRKPDCHHHLSGARVKKQEKAVLRMKAILAPMNIFCDEKSKLHNIITKQALTNDAQESILNLVSRGETAKVAFVKERIVGERNLWDRMSKVKYLNWDTLSKKLTMKGTKDFQFRSTTNLFSRLLIIAKSGRDLNLQQAISEYEFNNINPVLMKPDGTLPPCVNKSHLIHALESLAEPEVNNDSAQQQISAYQNVTSTVTPKRYLIIDGMAVVQTLMNVHTSNTCKEFGKLFVSYIDSLLSKYLYNGGRVIFDNYDKILPLKNDIRYQSCPANNMEILVADSTPIVNKSVFLPSNRTKDQLTIYLADKTIQFCKHPIVTVTRQNVRTNTPEHPPTTAVSTQEEADTLMIPHGIEVASESGNEVDFFTQDTDWFVLILRRLPQLGRNTGIVTGTAETRRRVALQPIYDHLGPERVVGMPGFHAITGCDITGHINGVGKKNSFKMFMKSPPHVLQALAKLGEGNLPSLYVRMGCEEFLCSLLGTKKISAKDASTLRWKRFKTLPSNQGVDKLPPTAGALYQHILRAHLQANIWKQDVVLHPKIPDPCKLGWFLEDGKLRPVLSEKHAAPEAVVELIRCTCSISTCSNNTCTCRRNNLQCTEMCNCEADDSCSNFPLLSSVSDSSDSESDEEESDDEP